VQALPQDLQLVTVFSGVSQPSEGLVLQSEYPVLHVGTQAPDVQTLVPWLFVHALPQDLQLVTVFSGVSQPSAALVLQSP
jgi:hypothetical protein